MKLLLVLVVVTREGSKRKKSCQPTQGVEVTLYLTARGMSAVYLPRLVALLMVALVALLMVTLVAFQMSSLADLVMGSASIEPEASVSIC